jgi:hypothetical protein
MQSIFTFPFEPIAHGLRKLSLSGTLGNVAAIILYCILCGSPVIYLLFRYKRKKLIKEDGILVLLSICLFGFMYLFINPGYIQFINVPLLASDGYLIALGCTLWSILICYVTLRILHGVEQKESVNLLSALHAFLIVIMLITLADIFIVHLSSLMTEMIQVADGNSNFDLFQDAYGESTFFTDNIHVTYIWLIIKCVLDIIPSLLLLWIISLSMKLIRSLKENPYEENTVTLAEMLGALCKNVVITISILIVITNVIQILFSPLLLSSQYQIYLPVYELLIVFIILLLSRKLSENRMLKLDNDSFI